MPTFIIFGYGVPKNILKDENYGRYLASVFNHIYDYAAGQRALVIFAGGPTDCFSPYRRTEAGEMIKLFRKIAHRPFVKKATSQWQYALENKSISGLENHLYSREELKRRKINSGTVHIFCEETREDRNEVLAKKIFKGFKVKTHCVDFDQSPHRYLDKKTLIARERQKLKTELAAFKDKKKFEKFIQEKKKRLEGLRKK